MKILCFEITYIGWGSVNRRFLIRTAKNIYLGKLPQYISSYYQRPIDKDTRWPIPAIKYIRAETGMTLKEAKQFFDEKVKE